jgi:hypothetical protein
MELTKFAIPRPIISNVCSGLCVTCALNKKSKGKGLVIKPIRRENFNQKGAGGVKMLVLVNKVMKFS